LVLHIAAWNETWVDRLAGQSRSEPVDGDYPQIVERSEQAWQQAQQRLGRSQEQLVEGINRQPEENFEKRFANNDYTLSFFLHGVVRHIVYHSGQLGILRKAAGKNVAVGKSSV
jgi:uncharacterized damage-inducible protein DinB